MPIHTMRGYCLAGSFERLLVDDGIFTHGHRIKSLTIIGANNGDIEAKAVLSYSVQNPIQIQFMDGNQIGWAIWDTDTTAGTRHFSLVDKEQIAQQDLYIHALTGALNYLVEVEPITMTEAQGVLQLVKSKRQA